MRKMVAFTTCFFVSVYLQATSQPDTFSKYPNDYFVETGSFKGKGIEKALKAGFKEIYSIELSQVYYKYCKEKFKKDPLPSSCTPQSQSPSPFQSPYELWAEDREDLSNNR